MHNPFDLTCIMQLEQFHYKATKVSSRKKCYYFWWSTWLLIAINECRTINVSSTLYCHLTRPLIYRVNQWSCYRKGNAILMLIVPYHLKNIIKWPRQNKWSPVPRYLRTSIPWLLLFEYVAKCAYLKGHMLLKYFSLPYPIDASLTLSNLRGSRRDGFCHHNSKWML